MPKGASIGAGFEWFAQAFEERTDGRYKVETYPSQSLTKIPVALDAVKGRVAEIIGTSLGTFERDFPLSVLVGLPWLGWPLDSAEHGYLADTAFDEFIADPAIAVEFKDFHLLQGLMLDSYSLFGNKDIRKAADFKGAKIGGSGPKMEIVSKNGGASVRMIPPQSYLTLDKGVADSGFLTFSQVHDYKLTEVCDYFYNGDFGGGTYIIMMNLEAFNEMDPADQKLINDTWEDAIKYCVEGSLASGVVGKQDIADAGLSIIEPSQAERDAWIRDSKPAIDYWVNTAVSAGIADPLPYYDKWVKIRNKYLAMH
jgi:TRAP-type C4-dicarboxylate transport system substrate-binding protein